MIKAIKREAARAITSFRIGVECGIAATAAQWLMLGADNETEGPPVDVSITAVDRAGPVLRCVSEQLECATRCCAVSADGYRCTDRLAHSGRCTATIADGNDTLTLSWWPGYAATEQRLWANEERVPATPVPSDGVPRSGV